MSTNLDRYKKDLSSLVTTGEILYMALQRDCHPKDFEAQVTRAMGDKAAKFLTDLPDFKTEYQRWHSEAKALIRQLLPDRLDDFVRHYEKPRPRKEITYESYRIEDCLQDLHVKRGDKALADPSAAIPHISQQLAILKAVESRFESSLYDIRQLAMADLFDSELDSAKELAKNKFLRAAGAVAGVVLEKHLIQICANHAVKILKKTPGISDLNNLLKEANVLDMPQWRFVQHLGDIRNLCDHGKTADPTASQVDDLITGVDKLIKTVF